MTAESVALERAPHVPHVIRERHRGRQHAHFGILMTVDLTSAVAASLVPRLSLARWLVASALPVAWVVALGLHRAYEGRRVATATSEFRRIARAAMTIIALAAFGSWWLVDDPRLLHDVLLVIPIAVVLTVCLRHAARRLRTAWTNGRTVRRALILGRPGGAAELIAALRRDRTCAIVPIATCPAPRHAASTLPEFDYLDVLTAAQVNACDTVIALPDSDLGGHALRQLAWELRGAGIDLVLAPLLVEVATDRLAVWPAGRLPLLHVRHPDVSRASRLPKEILDRTFAVIALVVLSPVMLTLAVMVRMGSPGPALFRQRRIGLGGTPFTMLKFRTMYEDAEQRKSELVHQNTNSDGLLFKIRSDPRVTKVGRFLRRYSLDELPQLVNVVSGSMSLIGPRPPLPDEVAAYSEDMRRRLLVKPGLTGLWQVSGRSDLPWADTVRLDLSYVENWSPGLDLSILLRTASAVVRRRGAY